MSNTVLALEAEIKKLNAEIQQLKKQKKYGLVWEDTPEKLDEGNIIPLVKEKKDLRIVKDVTKDTNYLIEGDNYHSLLALQKTHLGKIDVIYIDPPYNTGNEFVYNDKIVDKEDSFRHSKWLSFMSKRLKLAKSLLSEDGVIFISIDDNEQAQLKLLMDDIFGEQNSISPFIWEKTYSTKNNNKYTSSNHEYILVYVKNKLSLTSFTRLERTEKNNSQYKFDDNDGRGLYRKGDITAPNSKQKYVIEYKGRKYPPSKNGWRFTQDKMMQLIQDNRIYLPLDEGKRPSVKRYLSDVEGVVSKTILKYDEVGHTDMSKRELDTIIGDVSNFDYPKPVDLLKYLVRLHPNKNATVLDFFAGSGTTGHAVMELNKEDNGNRKFILCTNNEVSEEKVRQHFINQGLLDKNTKTAFAKFRQENEELVNQFYATEEYQKLGIARSVTYERLKRVIEGYTTPKGKFVEGLRENNLIYLQTKELEVKNEITVENSDDVKLYNVLYGKNISLLDVVLPMVKLQYVDAKTVVIPIEDTYEMPDLTEEKYKDKSNFVFLVDDSDKEIVHELTAILAEEFTSYNYTIEVTSTYIQP